MNRLVFSDLTAGQKITMVVAASIYHAIHRPDTDGSSSTQKMKLEILIRQAVFDALEAIDRRTPLPAILDGGRSELSKDDVTSVGDEEIEALVAAIPKYWEIPNAGYRLDENRGR